MKTVRGWWFTTADRCLGNGDGRPIAIGETHTVTGQIIPCRYGLHLSSRIIDALQYAPGPVVYRVEGSGIVVPHGEPVDKFACSERTYLAGGIDVSVALRKFARMCALDVVHLWDAPEIAIRYLKEGDESIRAAAWAAAWDAAGAAARDAAWYAAGAAARAAAGDAAGAAAGAAAWDAAGVKQNAQLTKMVKRAIGGSDENKDL